MTKPWQRLGIIFSGIKATEFDNLIGLNSVRFVDGLGINPAKTEIAFHSDDEKGPGTVILVNTRKVQIVSGEKVNGSCFYDEALEENDPASFVELRKSG